MCSRQFSVARSLFMKLDVAVAMLQYPQNMMFLKTF